MGTDVSLWLLFSNAMLPLQLWGDVIFGSSDIVDCHMYLWVVLPPKSCTIYKLPKGSMQYIHYPNKHHLPPSKPLVGRTMKIKLIMCMCVLVLVP